jgi:LuxR family maltose regulon positive regulatory protein
LVSRPRLVECLKTGLSGKLTVISAPAGFGKTTLLGEWIGQIDYSVAWVTLDEGDNDPNQFWAYVLAAMGTIVPELSETVLPGQRAPRAQISINMVITSLLNIVANSEMDVLLVLDDYHLITSEVVNESIVFLLKNLPKNMHLAIATRADPIIRLPHLRAQGELCEVRGVDLRFTVKETLIFLNQRLGLDLSPADVAILVEKTEGWIAGLQLAAITYLEQSIDGVNIQAFAGDDRHIADYLVEEVLERQPVYIQQFLLQTSILDQLCPPLCQAVTCRGDSQEILISLEAANMFLVPLDNRRYWYRYHHLFADLLRVRLETTDVERVADLHIKASEWYEQQGLINESVVHAIKAGDIERVENLFEANTLGMLEAGETATIDRWIRSLPDGVAEQRVWLSIAHAWSLVYSGNVEAVDPVLGDAEKVLSSWGENETETKKAYGHIATIRAYTADLQGKPDLVEKNARISLGFLPKDDRLARAFASMMLTTVHNRRGDLSNAEIALEEALITVEINPQSYIAIDSLCMMSMIQLLKGQLQESEITLRKAIEMASENLAHGGRRLPIVGFAHIYLGQLLGEWNQLEEAADEIQKGLQLVEPWGYVDSAVVGLMSLSLVQNSLGNTYQAFKVIDKAKQMAAEMPYWYDRVLAIEAWLATQLGDLDKVSLWVEKREAELDEEPEFFREMEHRFMARVLVKLGEYERAVRILKSLITSIEQTQSTDRLIRASNVLAVASYCLGERDRAFEIFERALSLAKPGGYVRAFLDEGEVIAKLLYLAIKRGIKVEYCSMLLSEFSRYDQPQGQGVKEEIGGLIEPLSKREIEVLELIASGCTNQEISQELVLSLHTVKSHAHNIYTKMGVKNRTEAVSRARSMGVIKNN